MANNVDIGGLELTELIFREAGSAVGRPATGTSDQGRHLRHRGNDNAFYRRSRIKQVLTD
jgi:hypothetical protein